MRKRLYRFPHSAIFVGAWLICVGMGCGGEEPGETAPEQKTEPIGSKANAISHRPEKIHGQYSKGSPALASYGGRLHMVHQGKSSNSLWHTTFAGQSWTTNVPLHGIATKAPAALAVYRRRLYMVYRGTHTALYYSWYDGATWSSPRRLSNLTSAKAVALAVYGGQLHMVYLRGTSRELWHTIFNGNGWGNPVRIWGQSSKATPALAALGNKLHLVHLGRSSADIWHSTYSYRNWTTNRRIGSPSHGCGVLSGFGKPVTSVPKVASSSPPALVATNGRLELIYRGHCGSTQMYQASYRNGSWLPYRVAKLSGFRTRLGPAAAVHRGEMHMAFIGSSKNSTAIYHGRRHNPPPTATVVLR